jgi:hypothetical protein
MHWIHKQTKSGGLIRFHSIFSVGRSSSMECCMSRMYKDIYLRSH